MSRRPPFPWPTPYVAAAIDENHDGRVAQAKRLIAIAAGAGADAVVLTFATETHGPSLAPDAARDLVRAARTHLHVIAAPHDDAAFDAVRGLRPDAYQIDLHVLSNRRLLVRIAKERRPVFVVAAACTTQTIRAALSALPNLPVTVLHAVAAPALAPARARLRYIRWLADTFKVPVGYAGYESGPGWAVAAAVLGATVIEKRITLDHTLPGAAHAASLDPGELLALVSALKDLNQALGPVRERRVFAEELPTIEHAGLSLVVQRRLPRGHVLRAADIAPRQGGPGLSPRLVEWVVGRRLKYDVEAGETLTFGLVDLR
jgi:sialic acid synthase SpsE